MTGRAPTLSVIIPVWNGARYLAEALESVLAQKAPSFEVIVVDDGSVDDSAVVADRFPPPVRCLRVRHGGLAAARNVGLDEARGEYLLHCDADDLLPPGSISVRMAALTASPDAVLVIGQMISFVSPELDPESAARYRLSPEPQRGGVTASIIRAAFAARIGRFDTSRSHGSDLDWMARASEQGEPLIELQDVVLRRRIHGLNMSLATQDMAASRLRALKDTLDRRRARGGPTSQ